MSYPITLYFIVRIKLLSNVCYIHWLFYFSEFYQTVASLDVLYRLDLVFTEDEKPNRLNGWQVKVRQIRMRPFSNTAVSINPLKTKRRLLYLKTQFVPRNKDFSSRL